MRRFILYIFMAAAGAASGCTKAAFTPAPGAAASAPTEKLLVFSNAPDRPYQVIGEVKASGNNKDKVLAKIKKQALAAGAEAIILTPPKELTQEFTSEMRTQFQSRKFLMRAIVIRFEKK